MKWTHDALWNKAKLYMTRALAEKRESPLFPLWATVALEFVGRATLARVHPSLLADPQTGDNVLYACGVGDVKRPRSIPAKTVFLRCQEIVEGFTSSEFGFVMGLIEMRNEELHSGGAAFEDYPTGLWLADFYRIVRILLESQGLTLDEFLGKEDAAVAEQMIDAARQERKSEVLKEVAAHRTVFEGLDGPEVSRRQEAQDADLKRVAADHKKANCPACGSQVAVTGTVVRTSDPRLEDDWMVWEKVILPNHMHCPICGLELKGHEALHISGLGGQFAVEDSADPREYYATDFDPAEYYGEEYMNE